MPKSRIKVGTRGSRLALAQADYVINLLHEKHADIKFEKIIIKTTGDTDRKSSLENIGSVGVFTKQIEKELLNGTIDIAIHSAKDLPSQMTDGLIIGAVPPRENCADVWISRQNRGIMETAPGARIGTGSPRRRALILNMRPDLKIENIRGNIETRLKKLDNGEYDALIMAYAGLKRINLEDKITEILSSEIFLPAAGQGALVVQVKHDDDNKTFNIVKPIDHPISHRCLDIERLLLFKLKAGCSAAIGGWARFENNRLRLSAVVLDKDGKRRLNADSDTNIETPDKIIVNEVVEQLKSQGAEEIIAEFK